MTTKISELATRLGLKTIAESVDKELEETARHGRPPDELLTRLFETEIADKEERSLAYRIKQAKLPWDWSLDSFPFDQQPGINKGRILSLAGLQFMKQAENIVFIGPPGTGKSGLAMGVLRNALINGQRGRFYNAQELMDDLYASLADRSTTKLLNRLSRYDLLVIDELGYLTLKDEQVNAFFRLIEKRYCQRSTIITTNLDYTGWYSLFRRKELADALLDRIKHRCITITIDGPSLRAPAKQT